MGLAQLPLQVFLLLCGATGCMREHAPRYAASGGTKEMPAQKREPDAAVKADKPQGKPAEPMDAQKAARAVAVLRVKFLAALGGNKYAWDRVEVLAVMKNDSARKFGGAIDIAHYSWKPGIPAGECTIYMVPYDPASLERWKLLDGTGTEGVSHVRR